MKLSNLSEVFRRQSLERLNKSNLEIHHIMLRRNQQISAQCICLKKVKLLRSTEIYPYGYLGQNFSTKDFILGIKSFVKAIEQCAIQSCAYDKSDVQNDSHNLGEKFECCLCYTLINDPQMCKECENIFCRVCLRKCD